jgi:hypothetical protein
VRCKRRRAPTAPTQRGVVTLCPKGYGIATARVLRITENNVAVCRARTRTGASATHSHRPGSITSTARVLRCVEARDQRRAECVRLGIRGALVHCDGRAVLVCKWQRAVATGRGIHARLCRARALKRVHRRAASVRFAWLPYLQVAFLFAWYSATWFLWPLELWSLVEPTPFMLAMLGVFTLYLAARSTVATRRNRAQRREFEQLRRERLET